MLNLSWLTEWLTAIGTAGSAIVAVGIAAYTSNISKKNEKNQALRYVFQLLDDNGHRNARRRIINLYGEDSDYRQDKILRLLGLKQDEIARKEAILKESQEMVKADFDQIGSLLKNKEIPRDEFIKIYWHDVLKCWQVLEEDIKKMRLTLNDKTCMENFQHLQEIATEYAKTKMNFDYKDIPKLLQKDIIVYPLLKIDDYNSSTREFTLTSDEYLNADIVNHDTIYLVDENNNRIDSPVDINYNDIDKSIIIKIKEETNNQKRYLYLSTDIKDIYGIPLKKYVKSECSI